MNDKDEKPLITMGYHWTKAAKVPVTTFYKHTKVHFDKIFIGHIDSDLNHFIAKYFNHKKANLCLPLTRKEVDLLPASKKIELPVSNYINKRNPFPLYTDFKGYFENLSYLWFRESTYLNKFECVWDCTKAATSLEYYTQFYNSIFHPQIHDKIEDCKLGMLMCQNCVKRTRRKKLYDWLKDKITMPKSTGIVLPEGQKETHIDHYMKMDPRTEFIEDMVLNERISALKNQDEEVRKQMEILCFANKRYHIYGSRRDKKLNPKNTGVLASHHVLRKMPLISWDAFNNVVFPCSIFIYNIADSEKERVEARFVVNMLLIKLLKMNSEDRLRFQTLYGVHTVVIISSLCTWGSTPFHLYTEFTDDVPLFEEYYNKRVPLEEYRNIFDLETYFLDLAIQFKDVIRIIVIGCGLIYGKYGQYTPDTKILSKWFMCTLFQKECSYVLGPGTNVLAIIHIKDLARLIHQAIAFCPRNKHYIIACELIGCNQHSLMEVLGQNLSPSLFPWHCSGEDIAAEEYDFQFMYRMDANLPLYPRLILETGFKVQQFWKTDIIPAVRGCIKQIRSENLRILVLGTHFKRSKIAEVLGKIFDLPVLSLKKCIKRFLRRMENIEIELNNEKIRKIVIKIARTRKITLAKLRNHLKLIEKLKLRKRVKATMVNLTMQLKLYLNHWDRELPIIKCDMLRKYLYLPKYKELDDDDFEKDTLENQSSSLLTSEPASKIQMTRHRDIRYLIPFHSSSDSDVIALKQEKSKLVVSDLLHLYEEEPTNELILEEEMDRETETDYGGIDELDTSWNLFPIYNNTISENNINPENEVDLESKILTIYTPKEKKDLTLNKHNTEQHLSIEEYLTMDEGDRKYKFAPPTSHRPTYNFKTTDEIAIPQKAKSVNEVFSFDSSTTRSSVNSNKVKRIINSYHDFYHLRGTEGNIHINVSDDSVIEPCSSAPQSAYNKNNEQRSEIAPITLDGIDKHVYLSYEIISKLNQLKGNSRFALKKINNVSYIPSEAKIQDEKSLVTERDVIKDFLSYFSRFSRHYMNRFHPRFKRRKMSSISERFKNPCLEQTPTLKQNPLIKDPEIKHILNRFFRKLILKMFPSFKKEKKKRKLFFIEPGEPPLFAVNGYPVFIFLRNILKMIQPLLKKNIIKSRILTADTSKVEPMETDHKTSLERNSFLFRVASTSRHKMQRLSQTQSSRFRLLSKYSLHKGEKEITLKLLLYRIQVLISVLSKCLHKMKSERHLILHEVAKLIRYFNKRKMVMIKKKKHHPAFKRVVSIANYCQLQRQIKKIGFKGKKNIVRVSYEDPTVNEFPDKFFDDFDEMMSRFLKNYENMGKVRHIPNQNYICNIDGKELVFESTRHPCIYFADSLLKILDCFVTYAGVLYSESAGSSDESDSGFVKISELSWNDFSLEALIYIENLLKNKRENRKYLGFPPGVTSVLVKDVGNAIQKKTDMFCNFKTSMLLEFLTGKPCLRKNLRLISFDDLEGRTLNQLCFGELVYIWRYLNTNENTLVDPEDIKYKIARIMLYQKEKHVKTFVRRFLSVTPLGYKDTAIYNLVRKAIVEKLLRRPDLIPPLKCERCGEYNKYSLFSHPELAFIVLTLARDIIYRLFNQLGEVIKILYRKRMKNLIKGKHEEKPFKEYLYFLLNKKYPILKTLLQFIFNRNRNSKRTSNQMTNLIQHKKPLRQRRLLRKYFRSVKNINKHKISFIVQDHLPKNRKIIQSYIDIMDCIHTGQSYRLSHYRRPIVSPRKVYLKKYVSNKPFLYKKEYKKGFSKNWLSESYNNLAFFSQQIQTGMKKNYQFRSAHSQPPTHESKHKKLGHKIPKVLKSKMESSNLINSLPESHQKVNADLFRKALWQTLSGVETTKYFSQKEKNELINLLISFGANSSNEESDIKIKKLIRQRLKGIKRKHRQFPLGSLKFSSIPRRKRLKTEYPGLKKIIAKVCSRLKNKPFLRTVKIVLNRLIVSVTSSTPEEKIKSPDNPGSELNLNIKPNGSIIAEPILKDSNQPDTNCKRLSLTFEIDEPSYSNLSSLLENRITAECEPILRDCLNLKEPNRLTQDYINSYSTLVSTTINKQVFDIIMKKLLGQIIINPNKNSPIPFTYYGSSVKKFTVMPTKKNSDSNEPDESASTMVTKKYLLFGASNEVGEAVKVFLSTISESIREEQSISIAPIETENKETIGVPKSNQSSKIDLPRRKRLAGRSRDRMKDTRSMGTNSTKDFQMTPAISVFWGKTKNECKVCIGPEGYGMDIEVNFEGRLNKHSEINEIIHGLRKCLKKLPKKKLTYRSSIAKKAKHKKKKRKTQKTKSKNFNIFTTKRHTPLCKHLLSSQIIYKRFKEKLKAVKLLTELINELKKKSLTKFKRNIPRIPKGFPRPRRSMRQGKQELKYSDLFTPSPLVVQKPISGLPKAALIIPQRKGNSVKKISRKQNKKNKIYYKGNLKKLFWNVKAKKKNFKRYIAKRRKNYLKYKSKRFKLLKKISEDKKRKRLQLFPTIIRGLVAIKDIEMTSLVKWTKIKKINLIGQSYNRCQSKINNILFDIFATDLTKLMKGDTPDNSKIRPKETGRKIMGSPHLINKSKISNPQYKHEKSVKDKDLILYQNFRKLFQSQTRPSKKNNIQKTFRKHEHLLRCKTAIISTTQKMRDFEKGYANVNKRLPKVTNKHMRACQKLQSLSSKNISDWQSKMVINRIKTSIRRQSSPERIQIQNQVLSRLNKREQRIRAVLKNIEMANSIINDVQDKKVQNKMKMELFFRKQKLQRKLRSAITKQRYFIQRIKHEKKKRMLLEEHSNNKRFLEKLEKNQRLYSSFLQNKPSSIGLLGSGKIIDKKVERNLRVFPDYQYHMQMLEKCHCPKPITYFHPKRIASQPDPIPIEPSIKPKPERRKINEIINILINRRKRRLARRKKCKKYKKNRSDKHKRYGRQKTNKILKKKTSEKIKGINKSSKKRFKKSKEQRLRKIMKIYKRKVKERKIRAHTKKVYKRRKCLFDEFIKDNEMTLKFQNRKYPSKFYHLSKLQEIRKSLQHRGKLKSCSLAVLMNEMLQEITFSDLSGYILDGFPRTAREAAIMFSDPPLYCHCKLGPRSKLNKPKSEKIFTSKTKLSNMNLTKCTGELFPCYCEGFDCKCAASIKLNKPLFPRFVIMPIEYRKSVPEEKSITFNKSSKKSPLNGIVNVWKKQLKFKKKLRGSLNTAANFFELYGVRPAFFPIGDKSAFIENIKKIVQMIEQSNDGKSKYKPVESVFKRKDPKVEIYKSIKHINKTREILKRSLRNYYNNVETTKARKQWLIEFNELLPKANKLFMLMNKVNMIRSLAKGIATSILTRLDDPILTMAIQTFKGNKLSEIPRKQTKVTPPSQVHKVRILHDFERMLPILPPKVNNQYRSINTKKRHNLRKIKTLVEHPPHVRAERVRFKDVKKTKHLAFRKPVEIIREVEKKKRHHSSILILSKKPKPENKPTFVHSSSSNVADKKSVYFYSVSSNMNIKETNISDVETKQCAFLNPIEIIRETEKRRWRRNSSIGMQQKKQDAENKPIFEHSKKSDDTDNNGCVYIYSVSPNMNIQKTNINEVETKHRAFLKPIEIVRGTEKKRWRRNSSIGMQPKIQKAEIKPTFEHSNKSDDTDNNVCVYIYSVSPNMNIGNKNINEVKQIEMKGVRKSNINGKHKKFDIIAKKTCLLRKLYQKKIRNEIVEPIRILTRFPEVVPPIKIPRMVKQAYRLEH